MFPSLTPIAMPISSRRTAGVAGGIFGEEGDEFVTAGDSFGDGAPPIVTELDRAFVEPGHRAHAS
jgi:hypothetical protein